MDGKALWYVNRGTGLTLLVLLSLVLVLGILARRNVPLRGVPRFLAAGLHRNASLLALVLLGVHVGTAVADPYAMTRLADLVLPFRAGYRPLWVGLGTLSLDIMLALGATSLLRDRLSDRVWRRVHWSAYACWPLAVVHGLGSGTDAFRPWSLGVTAGCVAGVAASIWWRTGSAGFRAATPSTPRSTSRSAARVPAVTR